MRLRAIFALSLIVFLATASVPVVFAIHIHQFSWGSTAYYPGDQATFYMTLFNDYPGTIYVKEVLMQWDWQPAGSSYAAPGGQTLIPIQTANYVINFTVPLNVTIGPHTWTVSYVDDKGTQIFAGQGSLKIHDPQERVYLALKAHVQGTLTQVGSTSFENPNATALIALANGAYNNATSLADQQDFTDAITVLKNASALIASAQNIEAAYQNLKKTYLSDLPQVTNSLDSARSSRFQSTNASQYLNQAVVVYDQATFFASAMKYARADVLLRNASALLVEANLAEQAYLGQGQPTSTSSSTTSTSTGPTPTTTSQSSTPSLTETASSSTSTIAIPAPVANPIPPVFVGGALVGFLILGSLFVLLRRRTA